MFCDAKSPWKTKTKRDYSASLLGDVLSLAEGNLIKCTTHPLSFLSFNANRSLVTKKQR